MGKIEGKNHVKKIGGKIREEMLGAGENNRVKKNMGTNWDKMGKRVGGKRQGKKWWKNYWKKGDGKNRGKNKGHKQGQKYVEKITEKTEKEIWEKNRCNKYWKNIGKIMGKIRKKYGQKIGRTNREEKEQGKRNRGERLGGEYGENRVKISAKIWRNPRDQKQ